MKKLLALALLFTLVACNKPLFYSKDKEMEPISRNFDASTPEAFKVTKDVLVNLGYKIERENESEGSLKTSWQSTKATSHYVDLFGRKDFGTIGAYYRIDVKISDKEGQAQVAVSAPVRSVITRRLKTNYTEEKKILRKIADRLRREDFEMNNVGVPES